MPYVARDYLVDPPLCPVWRYMNLEKLLSILTDKTLFFASVGTLAKSADTRVNTPAELDALGLTPDNAKIVDQHGATSKIPCFS
jgi:hypothetical protein